MKKTYIVCHMVQSVDGRIDCAMVDTISGDEYYDTLKTFRIPNYLNRRVTMEHYRAAKKKFLPKKNAPSAKTSVFVAEAAPAYVFACDTRGSLMWKSNREDNLPLVCIVGEQTSVEARRRRNRQYVFWRRGAGLPRTKEGVMPVKNNPALF